MTTQVNRVYERIQHLLNEVDEKEASLAVWQITALHSLLAEAELVLAGTRRAEDRRNK